MGTEALCADRETGSAHWWVVGSCGERGGQGYVVGMVWAGTRAVHTVGAGPHCTDVLPGTCTALHVRGQRRS